MTEMKNPIANSYVTATISVSNSMNMLDKIVRDLNPKNAELADMVHKLYFDLGEALQKFQQNWPEE